jgi:hypothetical protein
MKERFSYSLAFAHSTLDKFILNNKLFKQKQLDSWISIKTIIVLFHMYKCLNIYHFKKKKGFYHIKERLSIFTTLYINIKYKLWYQTSYSQQ